MKIDFSEMPVKHMPNYNGGEKEFAAKMYIDDSARIMRGTLIPGASIGRHTHENNSEMLYVLEGSPKMLYDDSEERLHPGDAHYCPKGHSHSLINDTEETVEFFAVVPAL